MIKDPSQTKGYCDVCKMFHCGPMCGDDGLTEDEKERIENHIDIILDMLEAKEEQYYDTLITAIYAIKDNLLGY